MKPLLALFAIAALAGCARERSGQVFWVRQSGEVNRVAGADVFVMKQGMARAAIDRARKEIATAKQAPVDAALTAMRLASEEAAAAKRESETAWSLREDAVRRLGPQVESPETSLVPFNTAMEKFHSANLREKTARSDFLEMATNPPAFKPPAVIDALRRSLATNRACVTNADGRFSVRLGTNEAVVIISEFGPKGTAAVWTATGEGQPEVMILDQRYLVDIL